MLLEGTAEWIVSNDDGTGQFGDVWDTEWVRAAAASIDAVLQSATNPTVTPSDLIDEVVDARGSMLSLDARLDVALNEDGTPKAVAGQAVNADLQAILQARNIVINGNLEDWTLGGALAPDNFVLSGAAVTIARTGPAMADTFTFGTGTYAAKLTRAGTDGRLTQTLISAGEMPAAADIKGKSIGVLVIGDTAIANHLRVTVDDGVLTSSSSFHAGDGVPAPMPVLHTLSASATKLEVYVQIMNSNGDAYVGGFTAVFSNLVPTRWLPLDNTPIATALRGGTISLGTQRLGTGTKSADGLALSRGAISHRVVLAEDLTDHATSGTGATDVWTLSGTLLGGTVLNNETLVIEASGDQTADVNAKTYTFTLGTTTYTVGGVTTSNGHWRARFFVTRVSASVQRTVYELTLGGGASMYIQYAATTENLDNALALKLTITHAVSGTTTLRILRAWIETPTV